MKKTQALRILEKEGVPYDVQEYHYDPENLDLNRIAQDNDLDIATVYKTLVLVGDKTGPLIAVVAGNHQVDLKALARVSGNKRVHMLPMSQLKEVTGYIRGGCSPLGMKKVFPTYFDQGAMNQSHIWVNAGIRGLLAQAKVSDWLRITAGVLANFAD